MKQQRQTAIGEVIGGTAVLNQDDLRKRLAARGFHVTQATLSRDIRELGLSKGPQGYRMPSNGDDGADSLPGIRDMLRSFGLEARRAKNLIVVITSTGGAQPVAAGIDYEDWDEVVGTIAGDDTVLVICADDDKATRLKTKIEVMIG